MNSQEIKRKVKIFQKEFKINSAKYGNLVKAAHKQGYTVIEFNHIFNADEVQSLIDSLRISDNILRSKGFTYADQSYRLIFIHEDLSENEKLYVLTHEIGHIYLGHMSTQPIIGKDVQDEYEANEFTHYILNKSIPQRIHSFIRLYRKIVVGIAIFILIVIGLLIFSNIQKERSYYGDYYVTVTGRKYHKKDCRFVKYKTYIERLTKEQFKSGEYEPCGICQPEQ